MPIFGEYETVEQISVTEEPRLVTTVWKARKSGGTDGRWYVIKCYASLPGRITSGQPQDVLQQDWSLNFLEGIKRLKRARTGEASCLAPVHAFGLTPEGAWFATDYYERRTLKEYIDLRGRVDSEALRQVLYRVITGCLAIKQSGEGKTHGNLKPSNVLLAGKPCPLKRTPLHLTDPHPAPRQLAALETADLQTGGDVPDKTMEIQDLRAIGELILQLVEGRLLRNEYEYNYPVVRSEKWDKLGKAGESWRALCNRLLDPRLSLEKESLEKLEKEVRPSEVVAKMPLILGVSAAVCLVVGGGVFGVHELGKWIDGQRTKKYDVAFRAAEQELKGTNLVAALKQVREALKFKPGQRKAEELKETIERQVETEYAAAFEAATNAWSQAEQEFKQERYEAALSGLDTALAKCDSARKLRAGTTVDGLRSSLEGRRGVMQKAQAAKMAVEQEYAGALQGATNAWNQAEQEFNQKHYDLALTAIETALVQCEAARKLRAGTTVDGLRSSLEGRRGVMQKAQAAKMAVEQEYAGALQGATNAWNQAEQEFKQERYEAALSGLDTALAKCEAARKLRSGASVEGLKRALEDRRTVVLARKGKGPGEEHPGPSHLAIAPGYDATRIGLIEQATLLTNKNVNPKGSLNSLGKLEDIALDLATGKLVMALVSFGSGPLATPVPSRSFSAADRKKREIDVDRKKFSSAPRVTKANWTGGLNASNLDNIARQFGQEPLEEASSPAGFSSGAALIRRPLANQAGEPLGQVEDLMVDLPGGRVVFLIVKPVDDPDSNKNLYVLPPASVRLNTNGGSLVLNASLKHFLAGPNFPTEYWTDLRKPEFAASVYQYYAPQKGGPDVVDPK
jgi:sporulation protein YlmC with PRC-barrel domain